jgi:alkylation response protein AidB-like acyl-CoA dehydrogenase
MAATVGADLGAFRDEVCAFLDGALTPELRTQGAGQTGVFAPGPVGRAWHRVLFEKGWITPTWPLEFGGIGWTPLQRYVFEQECALAEAPTLSAAGLQMCGPILIHFGTPQQQDFFLPRIRSGEHYWCQGYSEPGAGSDLAALGCRARRDGDDYLVDGTKIWTTHAHYADWMFLLVRTSRHGPPQSGITFLLVDMSSPGITIDPIISMSGEHEVNQVFFDGVRVPAVNRVGDENAGWTVAKRLLEFERGGVHAPRVRRLLRRAERTAREATGLWSDPDFQRRAAELAIEVDALEAAEWRLLANADGSSRLPSSGLLRVAGNELLQRAGELAVEAAGMSVIYRKDEDLQPSAQPAGALAMARYLSDRAVTIYGGSSEIQRNLLARAILEF